MDDQSFKDQKQITLYDVDVQLGTVFSCLFKNNMKLETQLVGYEQDNFFLLKFPTMSGIANYLVRDASFAALFKTSGLNVTFSSVLTYTIPRKFLAFCEFPSRFKAYEIRNAERMDCLLAAALDVGIKRYFCVVQDISVKGCKVTLDGVEGTSLRKLESGESVKLEVWTQKDTITVSATIMRVLKNVSRVTLGLSFGNLIPQDAAVIQSFILSLRYSGVSIEDRG